MGYESHVILHLSLINGVGPVTIGQIISGCSNLDDLYTFSQADIIHRCGVNQITAQCIVGGLKDHTLVEKELQFIGAHNAQWCTLVDDMYPALLKSISVPPAVLYWYGSLPHEQAISLIGARKANHYADKVTSALIKEINAPWWIISGGALGADTMAHSHAVHNGLKTSAVLGSGLLHWYPRANVKLFERIIDAGGSLISAFSMNTEARPEHFPMRNRIIAGLSQGIVVIQAAEKSGALITAEYGLSYGRDIFAVPGLVDDPLSQGCHILIKQGATLVTSAADITQAYHYPDTNKSDKKTKTVPVTIEDHIRSLCIKPQSIEEIAQVIKQPVDKVQELLFAMHLEGAISQDFSGMWVS